MVLLLKVSILYVMHALLNWYSALSFVNITDFTLSELWYLLFTESKLQSPCSHSSGQGSSSCWTLCTDLPLFSNLWSCYYSLQTCTLPLSDWPCHNCHTSCHMLDTVSGGALYCNIYSYQSHYSNSA